MYTHTIELVTSDFSFEGEISFNGGANPSFKTDAAEELTVQQHHKIQDMLECMVALNRDFGGLNKLEVVLK